MSESSKKSAVAPVIVIALLGACFLGYQFWLSPAAREAPPDSKPEQAAKPDVPDTPAVSAPEAAAPAPVPFTGPIETPASAVWSTYHGGTELTGFSEAPIPDKPVVRWRYQAKGPVLYTPVADETGIYASTRDATVCALDFEGKERWKRQLMRDKGPDGVEKPERIEAPLASFLSMVFVGTTSGKLYALDAATGETKWIYDVQGSIMGTVNISPAKDSTGVNRLFVIAQDDGVLHCIDAATGSGLWHTEPVERCDGSPSLLGGKVIYGSCAAALHVFSTEDGKKLRDIPLDPDSQVAGGVALAGDSIYSGSHSGYFYHADSKTGRIYWVNRESKGEIFSTPAISPEFVVFTASDGNVYGLDRRSGMRRWTCTVEDTATSAVIAGDKVVFGVEGTLHILNLNTGEKLWSQEISDEIASPALVRGMIIVGSGDGTVTAFADAA